MPTALKMRKKPGKKADPHTKLAIQYISMTQKHDSHVKFQKESSLVGLLIKMAECKNTFSLCKECHVAFQTRARPVKHKEENTESFSKVFTKTKLNNQEAKYKHVLRRLRRVKAIEGEFNNFKIFHYSNDRFCLKENETPIKMIETGYVFDQMVIKNEEQKIKNKDQEGKVKELTKQLDAARQETEETKKSNSELIQVAYSGDVRHYLRCAFQNVTHEIKGLKNLIELKFEDIVPKTFEYASLNRTIECLTDKQHEQEDEE